MKLALFAVVAVGGALGAGLRFFIVCLAPFPGVVSFPYGTLFVNVLGCFAMGLISESLGVPQFPGISGMWAFLVIGFLGGFTTLSGFVLEFKVLLSSGFSSMAALYVLATYTMAPVAFFVGIKSIGLMFPR